MIGRWVSLTVDDVLWSSGRSTRQAPGSLRWSTAGWRFKGTTKDRIEMSGADSPRLEVGHSYVIAVGWEEARCSPGDAKEPSGWHLLGSGAAVPFDSSTLGAGEFEGTVHTLAEMRDESHDDTALRATYLGKTTADLVEALERATPGKREVFTPSAPCDG